MDKLFGELRKLPCHYCVYHNSFVSTCLDRQQEIVCDGEHSLCKLFSPDIEIISSGIEQYFEYLEMLT